ncbi:MAG: hypothetical protein ACFE8E_07205 [Candidatus Hodarchaeota archaeon]
MEPRKSFLDRYRNLIVLYLAYVVFWFVLIAIINGILGQAIRVDLTRYIPINDLLIELAIIYVFILPISGMLGLLIGGYLLSPIIMILHKKLLGSKLFYGIQIEPKKYSEKVFTRAFFPILMAINISTIFISQPIVERILPTDTLNVIGGSLGLSSLLSLLAESVLLILTFGIALFFFSPVWFLKDSGIIYSNRERVESSHEMFTIKSIGDWFRTILKSYAGIGAIVTYILIIYNFINIIIENPGVTLNIPALVLWIGLPFYLTLSLIPTLICNDLIKNHRIGFIRKVGNKLGIKQTAVISFELKDDRV